MIQEAPSRRTLASLHETFLKSRPFSRRVCPFRSSTLDVNQRGVGTSCVRVNPFPFSQRGCPPSTEKTRGNCCGFEPLFATLCDRSFSLRRCPSSFLAFSFCYFSRRAYRSRRTPLSIGPKKLDSPRTELCDTLIHSDGGHIGGARGRVRRHFILIISNSTAGQAAGGSGFFCT